MLKLFCSYSHQDRKWGNKLIDHISGIDRTLIADRWYDTSIRTGSEWAGVISKELDDADVVVLLVSPNYISSEYCAAEADRAMARYQDGQALVIPVSLESCNTSGASFAALQAYPDPNKPILAARRKDQAFAEVSREIENRARVWAGARPARPRLDEKAMRELLHLWCDRTPQWDALRQALRPDIRKDRRPFVIVMRGIPEDSLELYLKRLRDVVLPRFLGDKPGNLTPLTWPQYRAKATPFELFSSRLEESLPVPVFATQETMNAALKGLSPKSLLFTEMSASELPVSAGELLDAYIGLWREWPPLPEGTMLMPVLALQERAKEPFPACVQERLQQIRFDSLPDLGGVVLPAMTPIEHGHFRDWIRHEAVRAKFSAPAEAVELANDVLARAFPVCMRPLAEVHLPRFLERL